MNWFLISLALVVGCVIGVSAGWMLRRRSSRWCRQCGQPIGVVCVECRDRLRAGNLRLVRGGRRGDVAGAA